jgi:hypothetical protein
MKLTTHQLRRIIREAASGHASALNNAEMALAATIRAVDAMKRGNVVAAQLAARQASFYLKSVQSDLTP